MKEMKKLHSQMMKLFMIRVKEKLPVNSETPLEIIQLISQSELYRFIAECLERQPGINSTVKSTLASGIWDALPEVRAEIERQAKEYIEQRIPAPSPYPEQDEADTTLERAKQAVGRYIHERTQRLDTRVQDDTDTLLRRMDALARLLTVNSRYSTCLSLTIHENALWVSLNRDKEEPFDDVLKLIHQRVDFLKKAVATHKDEAYETLWKTIVPDLVTELNKIGGSNIPAENLEQDLAKLIYSHGSKCSRLSEEQKKAFVLNDRKVIFLHAQRDEENTQIMGIKITEFASSEPGRSLFYRLPLAASKQLLLRQFHAEQLLIHYFRESGRLNSEEPVRLGITKLCCNTCHEFLHHAPGVLKRGTHGLAYEGTFNLHTGKPVQANGLNPRVTHPHTSPPLSPLCGNSTVEKKGKAPQNPLSPKHPKSPTRFLHSPNILKSLFSKRQPIPMSTAEVFPPPSLAPKNNSVTFFKLEQNEEEENKPELSQTLSG